ncbi:MAG: hypothetical protein JKY42_05670 [Flavobacteriales bacterium]|nr:hypothetical protein [Flavobacteriales bacterium]
MIKKKHYLIIAILAICLLSTEVFLRTYYGFCDTVLLKEDVDFEYIALPNQDRFRFRSRILYNSKSMRSEEVSSTAKKILGFGDSIINGGVLTDQDSLATTILSDSLTQRGGKEVQFLNISAGSWGPDNCYAYLTKFGDFDASHLFLFVSSHDAYDNMNFEKVVDIHKSFPSKQYSFALAELLDRYLIPRLFTSKKKLASDEKNIGINKKTPNSAFNTGFNSFLSYTTLHNIPFTIYLHADKEELKQGSYNEQGLEIITFAKENKISIILDLENNLKMSDFRDDIHINEKGQRKLALTIFAYLNKT